jgi:hypothetical protein
VAILSVVISIVIILALVMVPLALIAKLSLTVLARLLGVVSQSEVATRAEFARIREQLLATAGDGEVSSRGAQRQPGVAAAQPGGASEQLSDEVSQSSRGGARERASRGSTAERLDVAPGLAEWRQCPTCAASVASTARICLQCGADLSAQS